MRTLFLLILLLLPPLPLLAQQTAESDRGLLEGLLEDNLSDIGRSVDVVGFAGALSSTATIEKLTIADADGIWLTLNGVTLNWSRTALLSGRLEVNELSADEVLIPRAPVKDSSALPTPEAKGFALPELPVSVNIGKLSITRAVLGAALLGQEATLALTGAAQLEGGAGSATLSVTRLGQTPGTLALDAAYANATRDLRLDLSLAEPSGGIAASLLGLPGTPAVQLSISGEGPIDGFAATLALSTDGKPRLNGTLTLDATRPEDQPDAAPDYHFAADLGGDIAPVFAPEYRPFFGPDIRLQLNGNRSAAGQITLDRLDLSADALHLSGRARISPQGWPELLALTADITPRDGADVLLPLSGPATRLNAARLKLDYDAAKGDGWALDMALDGLDRAGLSLQHATLSGAGDLLRGTDTALGRVTGQATLAALGVHPQDAALATALGRDIRAALRFDWTQGQALRLPSLTLSGQDYALTGAAELGGLTDGLNLIITTDTTLTADNLTRFAPLAGLPLSGAAQLAVTGQVEPLSGQFDLRFNGGTTDLALDQPRIDPLIAGAGQLALHVSRDTTGTLIDALRIATAQATITGSGALRTGASQLTASARLRQAALVLPGVTGPATLDLTASQSTATLWQVDATATAPGEATAHLSGTITGNGTDQLDLSGQLKAEARDISVYSQLAGRPLGGAARLTAEGTGSALTRSFDTTLSLTGQNLSADTGYVDQLLRGQSDLQMQVSRAPSGRLSLKNVDLSTPELTARLEGTADETANALTFSARLRDLGLLDPSLSGAATAQGTATQTDDNWNVDVDASGPGGTHLTARGTVSGDAKQLALALDGVAPLALANNKLRPRSLSGVASFALRVDGPPALSSLSGSITTQNARLSVPDQRIALDASTGTIRLGGGQAVLDLAAQVSSGGTLQIDGPVTLTPGFPATLSATLRDITLSDPKLFETTVNGGLALNGPLTGGARITGQLDLGLTELRVPNPSGTNFADLPGLIHRNEPAEVNRVRDWAGMLAQTTTPSAPSVTYPLNIVIRAPSRIFVRGRGLDAELGGTLRLIGTTSNVVPQGRFDLIRGRMDILGKRLTLSEGHIRLQGAFDPYIRFVANTTSADVTASITIDGQASAPALTFSSSPDLPEDEVLSLILFGRELTQISPLQAIRLAAALRTLTGKGGDGLSGNLRRGLQLDDLDVTTTDEGATEARVGKYISENIYTEVTADTQGRSQINLNLTITPSLTARGRMTSDGETGLGLFLEKDY
ncbi:translocation/assembly module TamB domain-containing protein [Thalassovita taeanensis]|uniref:Autotransporter secretion inner membrane protein TamB n=1 Tax=Thalassovita taeanensis TaxID=657014 RepID=A0A1H9D7B2_9RHOB|nr:translocation/assembly module TamB domain-containing protein [Thalassovita taeanensis]SEQ09340.1 autotransporter secretion inner membrane protein TamB [Thalassovita taeanensis]